MVPSPGEGKGGTFLCGTRRGSPGFGSGDGEGSGIGAPFASHAVSFPSAGMAKRTHAIDEEGMGDEGDLMELMPLGAGQEVGRSCMCLKYKGKTVMVRSRVHRRRCSRVAMERRMHVEVEPTENAWNASEDGAGRMEHELTDETVCFPSA